MTAILTVEDLKTFAGQGVIEDDDRAEQVVAALNDYVERVTARSWGEVASGEEVHDFASVIFLKNMDVVSVDEVRVNDTLVSSSSYRWRSSGRMVLSAREAGFNPRYDEVTVSYTYGRLLVPADLKEAALSLALDAYTYSSEGQSEVTEEQIGSLRYKYATGEAATQGARHVATIKSYKRARV